MKWMPASGNMVRTSATSTAEAQSKWRTPPSQTARSTAGSGLHFTAYSVSPGKPRTKAGGGGGDGGRAQAMHRLLRPRDGDQGIDAGQGGGGQGGGGVEVAAQRGDGGAGADQVHRAVSSRHHATRRGAADRHGMDGGDAARPGRPSDDAVRTWRRRGAARRECEALHRGAFERHRQSLTTPAPEGAGMDEKDASRRCCAPG